MKRFLLVCLLLLGIGNAYCGTVIETEKPVHLTPTGSLGTCGYKGTPAEQKYLQGLDAKETVTGSFLDEKPYSIRGKKGKYVAWFAVVRGISQDANIKNRYRLLLEQKFFDGLTDCHIMLVSVGGAGDFQASVDAAEAATIPLLSLVRAYGKIVEEADGLPRLEAEYIRVWPWMAFTFTDLGPADRGNPKWRKLCKVCNGGRIYKPYPDNAYYLNVLGNPKDFESNPQKEQPDK